MKNNFYILLFLLISSCAPSERVPEGIMTKEQMIAFLIDLQITEAKISTLRIPDDTVKLFYREVEESLYKKHTITDSIYFRSMEYYLYDVTAMEQIYSAVVDSLSLQERLSGTD